jgi:hypothetical protein
VVAALQLLAPQRGKIRHDPQGDSVGLDENQRGLVLGIGVEAAHGRRKRPVRTIRELEMIGELVKRRPAGRLEPRHDANPRAVVYDLELADDAVLARRQLLDHRPAGERDRAQGARKRYAPGGDRGNGAHRPARSRRGHLDPRTVAAGQVSLAQAAIPRFRLDHDLLAAQHHRRRRFRTGRPLNNAGEEYQANH